MKAKEAIAQAKALLGDFYADEHVSGVRLEEVEFDEPGDSWLITLGLLRPTLETSSAMLTQVMAQHGSLTRTYKVFRIPNQPSAAPSMKMRELHIDG